MGVCFGEWLNEVFKRVDMQKVGEIAAVCWGLWKARNEWVWKNKKSSVANAVSRQKRTLTSG